MSDFKHTWQLIEGNIMSGAIPVESYTIIVSFRQNKWNSYLESFGAPYDTRDPE